MNVAKTLQLLAMMLIIMAISLIIAALNKGDYVLAVTAVGMFVTNLAMYASNKLLEKTIERRQND